MKLDWWAILHGTAEHLSSLFICCYHSLILMLAKSGYMEVHQINQPVFSLLTLIDTGINTSLTQLALINCLMFRNFDLLCKFFIIR